MMSASGPGSVARAQQSSQIAKPNSTAAAGIRPRRSGYSSGSGSSLKRFATQPVARPSARHGLSSAKTSPKQQREDRDADPEADVDRGRREVLALRVGAEEPGVDGEEEHEDAERAEHDLERAREREQHLPGLRFSRGAPSRARARRTRRPARLPRRRRTASPGSGDRRGRRCRGRRGARGESRNENGPADAGPLS